MPPHAHACARILQLTISTPREANLAWLDELPHAQTLCAHVCLKGLKCSSVQTSIDGWQRMSLHSCVEEPGGHENGHEGVCTFRFLVDNYDEPTWTGVYFLHGDIQFTNNKHIGQRNAFVRFLEANAWPAWPKTRAEMTPQHCGCPKPPNSPFGPRDFWYMAITWWLGTMITRKAPENATVEAWAGSAECSKHDHLCTRAGVGAYPLHSGTLLSPLGFMFAVDRASTMLRSRRFYEAQYRMCKVGVRSLPKGMRGAGPAIHVPRPGFDYNPLVWGHVNERLPYFLFGHEYEERPVPDCIWHGNHATMNCSQPLTPRQEGIHLPPHHHVDSATPHRNHTFNVDRSIRAATAAAPSLIRPFAPGGCEPFLDSCGSTG